MSKIQDQRKLGGILVERGIITSKQLEEALEEQQSTGRFIGEILVSRGVASEEKVAQCLSEQLGFAFVDIFQMSIEPKAKELVPEEVCEKLCAIPLYLVQDNLTVAMSNPLNIQAIDEIQATSGCRVRPVFGCPTAIRHTIEREYRKPGQEPVSGALSPFEVSSGRELDFTAGQIALLKQAASLGPVVEMVNNLITRAVEMSASDIHLEPERASFNCRYRIDGLLYPVSQLPLQDQAGIISRIKIMANMDIAEKRLPQDGRIQMFAAGRDVDLRISTFPCLYGENLVIRILDRSEGILKLDQLGFPEASLKSFRELIYRPYGIILVTGPTGSGKTTTLYAALSEINTLEKNIITLEDPVEYEIPHIRQSQVNVKAGLTFGTGLRSIVRQDPDIIMIGEIRDKETADIAIHAALTGHLVFSTLHTNDAPSAATRLIDMGVEPFLVASSIIGILAQRLVRILCPACKQQYSPSVELLKQLGLNSEGNNAITQKRNHVFYREAGCKKCKERGYLKRAGIFELLIPNDQIRELITQKASSTGLRKTAVESGMVTLRGAGSEKVTCGITSVSELLRVTEEV
jgi:type IV pilus assembly protein PilB